MLSWGAWRPGHRGATGRARGGHTQALRVRLSVRAHPDGPPNTRLCKTRPSVLFEVGNGDRVPTRRSHPQGTLPAASLKPGPRPPSAFWEAEGRARPWDCRRDPPSPWRARARVHLSTELSRRWTGEDPHVTQDTVPAARPVCVPRRTRTAWRAQRTPSGVSLRGSGKSKPAVAPRGLGRSSAPSSFRPRPSPLTWTPGTCPFCDGLVPLAPADGLPCGPGPGGLAGTRSFSRGHRVVHGPSCRSGLGRSRKSVSCTVTACPSQPTAPCGTGSRLRLVSAVPTGARCRLAGTQTPPGPREPQHGGSLPGTPPTCGGHTQSRGRTPPGHTRSCCPWLAPQDMRPRVGRGDVR